MKKDQQMFKRIWLAALILMLAAFSPAQAAVTRVDASPSSAQLSLPGSATLNLRWTVQRDHLRSSAELDMVTIVSRSADLIVDGRLVTRIPRVLSQVSTTPTGASGTSFFTDNFTLSDQALAALAAGRRGELRRSFTDGFGMAEASVAIMLQAAPLEASVSPERAVLDATIPGTVNATWTVIPRIGGVPLVSREIEIVADGVAIARIPKVLSRVAASGGSPVLFTETITIDRALLRRIAAARSTQLRRVFNDSFGSQSAQISVALRGGLDGGADVTRIELRFDDLTRTKLVAKGGSARAEAMIAFSGVGTGRFRWEVAGPVLTGTTPVFRPLMISTTPIVSRGRKLLKSPVLPTELAGTFFVRLAPEMAAQGTEIPMLQYTVLSAAAALQQRAPALLSPAPGTAIVAGTIFEWEAVPGASAYRIEFQTRGWTPIDETVGNQAQSASSVVTALAVAGSQTSVEASEITLARLSSRGPVEWQVISYDSDGRIIARSAKRLSATQLGK